MVKIPKKILHVNNEVDKIVYGVEVKWCNFAQYKMAYCVLELHSSSKIDTLTRKNIVIYYGAYD